MHRRIMDQTPGRKVWYQYWDTPLTFQRAYLARLRYVHENPLRHGITADPATYRWCSAAWFQRTAPASYCKAVSSMPIDRLHIDDDF